MLVTYIIICMRLLGCNINILSAASHLHQRFAKRAEPMIFRTADEPMDEDDDRLSVVDLVASLVQADVHAGRILSEIDVIMYERDMYVRQFEERFSHLLIIHDHRYFTLIENTGCT